VSDERVRRRSAAEASLRAVAGVSDIQVVGAISDEVAELVAIATAARSVWLHHETVQHIQEKRGLTREDSRFVLEYMAATILHPHYCCAERGDARKLVVVREVEPSRFLCVPLKVVNSVEAESDADEIWVSTGYPISRFLTRRRWRDTLKRVTGTDR